MQQAAPDSVPLASLRRPARPAAGKKGATPGFGLKNAAALFFLFLLVVSDVFTNSVLAGFRGAVAGRCPTPFGAALQGVFLVLFYVVAIHLFDGGVL